MEQPGLKNEDFKIRIEKDYFSQPDHWIAEEYNNEPPRGCMWIILVLAVIMGIVTYIIMK